MHIISEIKESVHYEAMTRTSDWQQKTIRSSLKSLKTTGNTKFEKDLAQDRRNKKRHIEHRRKYTSRLKKTVTSTLTASKDSFNSIFYLIRQVCRI